MIFTHNKTACLCSACIDYRAAHKLPERVLPVDFYDEPTYLRSPGYVAHFRERVKRKAVKVVELPFILRRQAS